MSMCGKMFGSKLLGPSSLTALNGFEIHRNKSFLQNVFGNYLLPYWNRYDHGRVKEIGVERAAAEWVLKNGGSIRWNGSDRRVTDYNALPMSAPPSSSNTIGGIYANNASLTYSGFRYLQGMKGLKELEFSECDHICNACLGTLDSVKQSLESLKIHQCSSVSDSGIHFLSELTNLKQLSLSNLAGVRHKDKLHEGLRKSLENCKITWEN